MARKDFPEDEPLPAPRAGSLRAEMDVEGGGFDSLDVRPLDLEPEQESPFLRQQKRVPVRRGPLPKKTVNKLKYVLAAAAVVAVFGIAASLLYHYGRSSWRFRLESSDQIQLNGNRNVTRAQVMDVFGADISRNVFLIPLSERKGQLERIPWIESATVMRLLPNRLRVEVLERTPTALVQLGSRIVLADRHGVLMEMPPEGQQVYSFPVIVGFAEAEPLSKRAASMKIYENLLRDLDSGGANYSHDVSEVDLSDPEDVRISVTDPQGEVLLHLGSGNFLERYKIFVGHVQEWRQQFQRLESVDLRYDRRVIVNPDAPRQAAAPASDPAAAAPVHAAAKAPHKAAAAKKGGRRPAAAKHGKHLRVKPAPTPNVDD